MFWGGPEDHFGMLAGFQKAVISICICCLGVARWNYFSNMWDRQISMRLTRGATYVVGGRVEMDETRQVNIHFNWDNLSLFSLLSSLFLSFSLSLFLSFSLLSSLYPYSLLVYSSLRAEWARQRVGFLPYVIFALKTCIPFGAVPKKSKKREAKTLLLKIWCTPIALPASRWDLLLCWVF